MSESEQFTSIEEQQPKHRGSQLLVIAIVLVIVFGGVWAIAGQWIGLIVLGGGVAALIVMMLWAMKNWEWDR
jgi:F0F1-type ATP synthase assembly protein I